MSGTSPGDSIRKLIDSLGGLNLTEDQINMLTQALPLLALSQQQGQFDYQTNYLQYQNDYLGYLQGERKLNEGQLAQAKQELDFQQGPYWDWYVHEYFPAQQQMSKDQSTISSNNVYQEEQRTKQAQLATQAAYAQMFKELPTLRSSMTSDGRNVPGMLAYTLGYS